MKPYAKWSNVHTTTTNPGTNRNALRTAGSSIRRATRSSSSWTPIFPRFDHTRYEVRDRVALRIDEPAVRRAFLFDPGFVVDVCTFDHLAYGFIGQIEGTT